MGLVHTGNGTIIRRGHPLPPPPKSPMEENRIPKILVISEGDFPKKVESRTWEDVGKGNIPNIAEFDIVILNFVRMTTQKAWDIKNAPKFDINSIHNLLWSGNELILITDGEVLIPLAGSGGNISYILPVLIPLEKERGETILVEDEKYSDYYEHVEYWNFYIKNECNFPNNKAEELLSEKEYRNYKNNLSMCQLSKVIARNGFDKPISFSIKYGFIGDPPDHEIMKISGPLTILQAPDKTESVESAIKTLLSNYGVHIKSKAPTWTNDFKIPGEEVVGREIKQLEEDKIETEEKITSKEAEKEEITRYKELLFEDGDELRDIVWDTLDQIGFKVNRHDEYKEDGSIQEGKEVAVLEIKGREKSLTTGDVRQLDDWIGDYAQREGKEPIGILIGNHYRLKKPENRDDPFPPDVLRYVNARSTKLSMITTHQLFELFCMIKDGKLDADTVRKEIMSNKGVFDLEPILE